MPAHYTKASKGPIDGIFFDKDVQKVFTYKLPPWLNYGLSFIAMFLLIVWIGIFTVEYSLSTEILIQTVNTNRSSNDSSNVKVKQSFKNNEGLRRLRQIACEIVVLEKFASKLSVGDPIKLIVIDLNEKPDIHILGSITNFRNIQRDGSQIRVTATFTCKDNVQANVILKKINSTNTGLLCLPPRTFLTLFTKGLKRVDALGNPLRITLSVG